MKRLTRAAASTAISSVLALGTVGVASAHDASRSRHHVDKTPNERRSDTDHHREAGGRVTVIGNGSITVQRHDGATTTYATSSTTSYFMGETATTAATLAVGEMVDVSTNSTAPLTATAVEIELAHVNGKVTAVSGDTITVGSGPKAKTIAVSASTTFRLRGALSTLGAVVVGSRVEARGVATSNTSLDAASVRIELVRLRTHVEGTVTSVGPNSVTVRHGRQGAVTFPTTSSTTVDLGKTASSSATVESGEQVDITLTPTAPQTVASVDVDLAKVEGTVTAINGDTITLNGGSDGRTVILSSSTTYAVGDRASTQNAVVLGSKIKVSGVRSSSTTLDATSVEIKRVRLVTHVEGTLTAIGTDSLTVQKHNGTPTTYATTAATAYTMDKVASTSAALAVGESLELTLTAGTPQTVTNVKIDLSEVHGVVTAISGNAITLGSGTDAKTITVDAATTFSGVASGLATVAVGDQLEARGVWTSGSAFAAVRVSIDLND